jgi:hypothetical protein
MALANIQKTRQMALANMHRGGKRAKTTTEHCTVNPLLNPRFLGNMMRRVAASEARRAEEGLARINGVHV